MKSQPCASLVLAVLSAAPLSAGDFVNLDFEHPNLSHATPDAMVPGDFRVPTKEALQGWTLTADVFQPTTTFVTGQGANRPPVALSGGLGMIPGTDVDFGKHELYLADPSQAPGSLRPIYHLSQLGTIPIGAVDLIYYRAGSSGPNVDPNFIPFKILINGQSQPYTEDRFTSIGRTDVSAYAGQEVSLEFVFSKGGDIFDISGFKIVPEPSICVLLGLGAVALGWQCWRRSHS